MTDRKERPKGKAALEEIDLRLGGLFEQVSDALGQIAEAAETRGAAAKVERHVSVRVGGVELGQGAPQRDAETPRPRNPPQKQPPPARQEDRPPEDAVRTAEVEIFDEAAEWVVTADLPGVEEAALTVAVEKGALSLATHGRRRYTASVSLPPGLALDDREVRLSNGILEVRIPKVATHG